MRLQEHIKPTRDVIPACLWSSSDYIPFTAILAGPKSTKGIHYKCTYGSCLTVHPNAETSFKLMQKDECETEYRSDPEFEQGVGDQFLCGQQFALNTNGTCIDVPGAVLQKGIVHEGVVIPHVVGLYSYSKDCHKGKSVLMTRISFFTEWILNKM